MLPLNINFQIYVLNSLPALSLNANLRNHAFNSLPVGKQDGICHLWMLEHGFLLMSMVLLNLWLALGFALAWCCFSYERWVLPSALLLHWWALDFTISIVLILWWALGFTISIVNSLVSSGLCPQHCVTSLVSSGLYHQHCVTSLVSSGL